jgi:peptidoglycan-associated lipoprotein
MRWGKRSCGLAIATTAFFWMIPSALPQEIMQLGAPMGLAAQFQTEVGDRVFFSDGSAELGSRARAALEAQAAWLLRHERLPVTVEGHADDAGSVVYNVNVSRQRAEVVRRRLIERCVAPLRIRVIAQGRERLIANCPDAGCAAQNRRVVTIIADPDSHASAGPGPAAPEDRVMRRPARRLY